VFTKGGGNDRIQFLASLASRAAALAILCLLSIDYKAIRINTSTREADLVGFWIKFPVPSLYEVICCVLMLVVTVSFLRPS
jgi:hypothetical protein